MVNVPWPFGGGAETAGDSQQYPPGRKELADPLDGAEAVLDRQHGCFLVEEWWQRAGRGRNARSLGRDDHQIAGSRIGGVRRHSDSANHPVSAGAVAGRRALAMTAFGLSRI